MSSKSKSAGTLSGALSGGAAGASAGSAFGPYGTAIGGIGGALVGGVGGYTSSSADEDANANDPEEIMKRRKAEQMRLTSMLMGRAFAAIKAKRNQSPMSSAFGDTVMQRGVA